MSGIFLSLCGHCAERIGKIRDLDESSREFLAYCSNCRKYGLLIQYEVGMTHAELIRRRIQQQAGDKNKKVSGERGRAERRSINGKAV